MVAWCVCNGDVIFYRKTNIKQFLDFIFRNY